MQIPSSRNRPSLLPTLSALLLPCLLATSLSAGCKSGEQAGHDAARDTALDGGWNPGDAPSDGDTSVDGEIPRPLIGMFDGDVQLDPSSGPAGATTSVAAELVESNGQLRGTLSVLHPNGEDIYFHQTITGQVNADRTRITLEVTAPRCADVTGPKCLSGSNPKTGETIIEARGRFSNNELVFREFLAREPVLGQPAQAALMENLHMAPNGGFKPSGQDDVDGGIDDGYATGVPTDGEYTGRVRGLPGVPTDDVLGAYCSMSLAGNADDGYRFGELECGDASLTDDESPRRVPGSVRYDAATGHIAWQHRHEGQTYRMVGSVHAGRISGVVARAKTGDDITGDSPAAGPMAPSEVATADIVGSFGFNRKR